MRITIRSLSLVLPALVLLTLTPPAHARLVSVYPVNYLCLKARYIVEGKYLGNSKLTIEKIYKGADYLNKETELTATGLDKCSRTLGEIHTGKTADADHVLVFLDADRNILSPDDYGSSSVFWIGKDTYYHYTMGMDDYVLSPALDANHKPLPPEELRTQIATGLKILDIWNRAKDAEAPVDQARGLAQFLRLETAPPGYNHEFDYELRKALPKLAPHSTLLIADAITAGNAKKENLNNLVLILNDMGPDAKPAVPALLALLKNPGPTSLYYIASALRRSADPRAIPALRTLVQSSDHQAAEEATLALTELGAAP